MSEEEWAWMAPLIPGVARTGRSRRDILRKVVDAPRHLVRTGSE